MTDPEPANPLGLPWRYWDHDGYHQIETVTGQVVARVKDPEHAQAIVATMNAAPGLAWQLADAAGTIKGLRGEIVALKRRNFEPD